MKKSTLATGLIAAAVTGTVVVKSLVVPVVPVRGIPITWCCLPVFSNEATGLKASTNLAVSISDWPVICEFPAATNNSYFDTNVSGPQKYYVAFTALTNP